MLFDINIIKKIFKYKKQKYLKFQYKKILIKLFNFLKTNKKFKENLKKINQKRKKFNFKK